MTCCGKRRQPTRARVRAASPRPKVGADAATARIDSETSSGVLVEYRGEAAVVYRGPSDGRTYTFSAGRRVRRLESHDAERLLRSPLFRRAAQ